MMKKILLASVVALMATSSAWAQFPDPFLPDEQRPNGIMWLPEPPSLTGGDFYNDFYYYQWGKEQRDEEWIAEWALWDEGVDLSRVFSPCLDFPLTHETTPEILRLAEAATSDAVRANSSAKNYYKRKRPFATFNEPSLKPEEDEEEALTYSYPSGHSSRGWMYALALATVAPERTEILMLRARYYAIHRVICGHHWKSDIDAGKIEASVIFAAITGTPEYQEQLQKARAEYLKIAYPDEPASVQQLSEHSKAVGYYYDLLGRKLESLPAHAPYIHHGKKYSGNATAGQP